MITVLLHLLLYEKVDFCSPKIPSTHLYLDECLRSHNALRFLHEDTPALKWDARLAADAQRWSDRLARSRSGYHDYNRNDGSGESWWYWTWYDDSSVYSCADAVRAW